MARKYTILKVLLQNSSKIQSSDKGFTLIELIFGLLIMLLVGGFAMNAFIQASSTFNKDKKNIDSSQNLSAIMELIGNDIKQSGEQIPDGKFPAVTIESGGTGTMPGSSKVTIRRALAAPLTLCEDINDGSSNTQLIVTNDSLTTQPNCKTGTTVSTTSPFRPTALKEARDYRCKLDDVNGNYTDTTVYYCDGNTTESVLAFMSDQNGNVRSFRYIDDSESIANVEYLITTEVPLSNTTSTSTPITTASYAAGSPIYLVEERVYTLNSNGNLQLQIDRGNVETLIKKIDKFNISAKIYSDTTTRVLSTAPVNACVAPNEIYSCTYSMASTMIGTTSTSSYSWKNIAGVKVELQSKYDATGRAATASDEDTEKLKAQAEFFPRNVLSK
jgi:prepilin-type N-terminal cleavage/methylation domain-containing protein